MLKKVLVIFIVVLCFYEGDVGALSLKVLRGSFVPSEDFIYKNLIKFYNDKVGMQAIQISSSRPTLLNVLCGANFSVKTNIFNNCISFNLGYNFMKIISFHKLREDYKMKLKRFRYELEMSFNNHIKTLFLRRYILERNLHVFNKSLEIFRIKEKVFLLTQTKYERGEISPNKFYKVKISFESDRLFLEKLFLNLCIERRKLIFNSEGNAALYFSDNVNVKDDYPE